MGVVAELQVLVVLLRRGAGGPLDVVGRVHWAHTTEEALLLYNNFKRLNIEQGELLRDVPSIT